MKAIRLKSFPEDPAMKFCLPILSLLVCTLAVSRPAAAAAVAIPDKNLEAALRSLVFEKKDDPKKELTEEDLNKIFIMQAKGKGIKDLTGLEKCLNLQLLDLANNEVADLAPIKGLTHIQSLDLSQNKITDLAPLTGLAALQYLHLGNNQIANVTPLSGITKLSALYLPNNKIADVAPLGKLTGLVSLDLGSNQVASIASLETITGVTHLKLNDNQIADPAPLAKFNRLSMLFLERNKLTDLAPLVASAKADAEGEKRFAPFLRLYLTGNPLSDDAKNKQLAELKKLGVRVEF